MSSVSSEDFASFSDSEHTSQSHDEGSKPAKPAPKKAAVKEKDSDEEDLEQLVLGNKASFREQLFKEQTVDDAEDSFQGLQIDFGAPAATTGFEELDDSALFFYDNAKQTPKDTQTAGGSAQDGGKVEDAPVWEDSDDERLSISLASVGRLRKLRTAEAEDVVSGTEYIRRLRQQYLRLHPAPAWATEQDQPKAKRRRRSSATSVSSDSEQDGEGGNETALPLDTFLRSARAMRDSAGSAKKRRFQPEVIDIQKTREIPDQHAAPVGTIAFHPQYPVLLSSSTSSILNLHHIAPTAYPTPNPLLTSVKLERVGIQRSAFVQPDGNQIIFAGRRKFFHSWDITTGKVTKISKIQGHKLEHKTMERFRISPNGRHMAIIASTRKGGGILNILDVNTMQWVGQSRLDSRGGIVDFCWWSSGEGITILGKDGQVGEWSLESRRFVGTWRDEGSIGGTVLSLGGHYGPAALGGDKWVAVGSNSGILNVYDRHGLLASAKGADVELKPTPEPVRAFDQLTTPITAVAFTPDGQLLAFASGHKKDALKLVHLGPPPTVYRNWPTEQTPLGRITAIAFGRESNMLAVGNDRGKIRLWDILA